MAEGWREEGGPVFGGKDLREGGKEGGREGGRERGEGDSVRYMKPYCLPTLFLCLSATRGQALGLLPFSSFLPSLPSPSPFTLVFKISRIGMVNRANVVLLFLLSLLPPPLLLLLLWLWLLPLVDNEDGT